MRLDCWMVAAFAVSLFVGCDASDGSLADNMPEDVPAGQGTGTSSDATTDSAGSGTLGECQSSADCLGNDVCAAPWDPETQTPGTPECSFACIALLDDAQWCADAAACCDPNAICTDRGYCALTEDAGGTDTTGGSGGSTGGGSTGDDSGSSEGTGTTGASDTGTTGGGR